MLLFYAKLLKNMFNVFQKHLKTFHMECLKNNIFKQKNVTTEKLTTLR